jgi:glycosyltransferase involved in cell wall biosynthesis
VKIVSVLTSSSLGGAEFAAVEMLDALADRGHEPVLLTDQPGIGRDTAVRVEPIDTGPKLSRSTYATHALLWPQRMHRMRRALAAQAPYDVLLVHYKKEQLLAATLPAELRETVVWAEWGPVPFPMRKGLPRRAYLAAAERCALVMAVSQGTLESVCDVGVPRSKVTVVPNVVRTDEITFEPQGRERVRSELGIPPDAFVVGCISRLHPKKRNDVVVEAMGLIDPSAHLIMAGDGETEAELRELARPLGERAHFIPTPRGDVADVLSSFDVSVFGPSPTEGAPRAVILGMLAERPCLSTGAEGVADMIDPAIGGIAARENDPEALAELIRPYVADPASAREQGRLARERAVARYSAPVVAEQVEALFERARRKAPPPA